MGPSDLGHDVFVADSFEAPYQIQLYLSKHHGSILKSTQNKRPKLSLTNKIRTITDDIQTNSIKIPRPRCIISAYIRVDEHMMKNGIEGGQNDLKDGSSWDYPCFVYPCASVYGLHIIVIVILYRLSLSTLL